MRSANVSSYAMLNLRFSRRALSRLDEVFQASEEAFDARIPLVADHQSVHHFSEEAELQLVLHPLTYQSAASVLGECVAVLEASDRQRTFEEFKRDRLVRFPVSDLLLEPAAGREVAPAGRSGPLFRGRDDLLFPDAGVVLIE